MSSAGLEAIELAASAGLVLDPWQQDALVDGLAERPDGKWAAFEVGLVVPRQNGKGSILEARELAGLFLFNEQLILHSAHEFKTSSEAFRRIWSLIQNTPDLERRVLKVFTSHGQEGIELRGGQRLRFVARTSGSGRGFTGDTIILDEAFNLPSAAIEALVPTMAARPNGQLWYTSSAPLPGEESAVLRRLCKRGRAGADRLAFMEFCADDSTWDSLDDRKAWADANPALGFRIDEEFILLERDSFPSDDGFARERLGLWRDDDERVRIIPLEQWEACEDSTSQIAGPVCLAFDVTPDGAWSSIVAAGLRADGLPHVEVVAHRARSNWVVADLERLVAAQRPTMVICDPAGPAGGLVPDLLGRVDVELIKTRDATQACALMLAAVTDGRLRHLGQPDLATAVDVADRRPVGDAWMWSRKNSNGVISPLVAATLAVWGVASDGGELGPDDLTVAF